MPRPNLNLSINIENIHCFSQSDNWLGSSEPYLWAVFFKIDGDTYAFEPNGVGLIGFPTIFSTNGSHGNLPNDDVDDGEDVPVPDQIGLFQSTLRPIPVNDPEVRILVEDLPGICGVAAVLMEEDSWPDNLADVGYKALVDALNLSVLKIAQSFQHALSVPTPEEIAAAVQQIKDNAATMVHDAVEGAMSGIETIWFGTVGNNDDQLGSQVWTWISDDFEDNISQDFSARFTDGGNDWEINGVSIGVVPCPAEATNGMGNPAPRPPRGSGGAGVGAGASGSGAPAGRGNSEVMQALREFRDKEFHKYPGLTRWWSVLSMANAHFIKTMIKDPSIKDAVMRLFHASKDILKNPHEVVPSHHWDDLEFALVSIARQNHILKRSLAKKALSILPELKGKTFNAAIKHLSDVTLKRNKKEPAKKKKK